jgi:hypothetical protein
MAKISNTAEYPYRSPQLTDYVIGTASTGTPTLKTSNFLISDIIALIPSGPGPGPITGITDLTLPIWDDTNSAYADSVLTQDAITGPKYINVEGLFYQTKLGGATYFGYETGKKTVTDSDNYNTGFGYEALEVFTEGDGGEGAIVPSYSTAVGYQSLQLNIQSLYNTSIGGLSSAFLATGNNNTTVGFKSLYSDATSNHANNTIIGSLAGKQEINQGAQLTDNVAIGAVALSENKVSNPVQSNVAIGSYAASLVNESSESVLDTFADNVAVGPNAFKTIIGGRGDVRDNVLIGNGSGQKASTNASMNQNIGIGKYALSNFVLEGASSFIEENNLEIAVDVNNILGDSGSNYYSKGNIVIGGNQEVRDDYNLMIGYLGNVSPNKIGTLSQVNQAKFNIVLGGSGNVITGEGSGTNRNTIINSVNTNINSVVSEAGFTAVENFVVHGLEIDIDNSSSNFVTGDTHVISGGNDNTVFGRNHTIGAGSTGINRYSLIIGQLNDKQAGENNFITGSNNVIQASEPTLQDNSSMLGSHLELFSPSCTVVGTYNIGSPSGQAGSLFMVGYGDVKLRANAFNVNTNGILISDSTVSFNYADDAAAAAGGIPIGGVYHLNGALRIRIT